MSEAMITTLAGIIVAIVAALGGVAAQRQASKATIKSDRLEAEREAYHRARTFDVDTITRQDAEILELRAELDTVRRENLELRKRVYNLELRLNSQESNYDNGRFTPGYSDGGHPEAFEGGANSD